MNIVRTLILAAVVALTPGARAQSPTPALQLKVYNADANSFHVNSVLVTGRQDAVLIDAQFTRADAHRLVGEHRRQPGD